jgi:hypothetical protein
LTQALPSDMCIEDALRTIVNRLATVRLLADSLGEAGNEIHPEAFSGLADIVEEMGDVLSQVKKSLPVSALGIELTKR